MVVEAHQLGYAAAPAEQIPQRRAAPPRPVFPGVLLPLAGECALQVDYARASKLIECLEPVERDLFTTMLLLVGRLSERPGFDASLMAAGLSEALMQVSGHM